MDNALEVERKILCQVFFVSRGEHHNKTIGFEAECRLVSMV